MIEKPLSGPGEGLVSSLAVALISLACGAAGRGRLLSAPDSMPTTSEKIPRGYQSVGVSTRGDFLVVWQEITPDGKQDGLWSQWFSPSGQPLGSNRFLQVSKSQAYGPLVAPGTHGGVLVLWRETHNTTFGEWDALIGGELLPDGSWAVPAHRITFLGQLLPRFASPLPQGGYAIALLGSRANHFSEDRTFLVLTDSNLKVTHGPSPVSPVRQTIQEVGGLAVSPTGEFLVTWTEAETTILAQLFSPTGRPLAKAFTVPSGGTLPQYAGAAAPLGNTGYVIVWSENLTSQGIPDLIMRLLNPDGTPRSAHLRLDPEIRFSGASGGSLGPCRKLPRGLAGRRRTSQRGLGHFGRLYHPDGTPFGPKCGSTNTSSTTRPTPKWRPAPTEPSSWWSGRAPVRTMATTGSTGGSSRFRNEVCGAAMAPR